MSVSHQIVTHLPYLRRYARALAGSQKAGDAYVIALLESLVADSSALEGAAKPRIALYKMFSKVWNSTSTLAAREGEPRSDSVEHRIEMLTPLPRQAFLLTSMEDFTEAETAEILGRDVADIGALLAQANDEIADQVATDVLIIEDEPLIAMDLEHLMEGIGHHVIGIATTQTEAIAIANGHKVGLILADIQLADGSSGLDAVNELLDRFEAPVIFITAFPERLLTGQRAEPTYLVTKPFNKSVVAAIASQALFFGEKARKGARG